jgi:hypothetical protein
VKRAYCKPKDLFPMEIIVTDIDGKPLEEKKLLDQTDLRMGCGREGYGLITGA